MAQLSRGATSGKHKSCKLGHLKGLTKPLLGYTLLNFHLFGCDFWTRCSRTNKWNSHPPSFCWRDMTDKTIQKNTKATTTFPKNKTKRKRKRERGAGFPFVRTCGSHTSFEFRSKLAKLSGASRQCN